MSVSPLSPVLRQFGQKTDDRDFAEDSVAGIQAIPACLMAYIEPVGDGYRTVSLFDFDQMNASEHDTLQPGQSIVYMDKSRIAMTS